MSRRAAALVLLSSLLPAGVGGGPVRAQEAQESWAARIPATRAIRRLRHPDVAIREVAARELASRGEPQRVRHALLEALATEQAPTVRAAIARSLVFRPHPESLAVLARAFDAARDVDARPLALALAAIGTPEAARVLAQGLMREELAAGARVALERMGLGAAPQLARLVRDDPSRLVAIDLLGRLQDVESVPLLVHVARSEAPAARRAALDALGRIGDLRGRGAVVDALDDPEPAVSGAAWRALGRVGLAEDADRVLAALAEADADRQPALLRTLLLLDEARGIRRLVEWLTSADAERVRVAGDVALTYPRPASVPALDGLFREGSRREEAAAALAEVEGGAGVGVLLREVERPAGRRALAVAVRRWRGSLGSRTLRQAHRALARAHRGARGAAWLRLLVLRALAQDTSTVPAIRRALGAPSALRRAAGAYGAWLLGDPSLRQRLEVALTREEDPEVWGVVALALASIGGGGDGVALLAALEDPTRAPEAAILAAGRDRWRPRDRRRVGRALRRLLRSPDPRARACAAWSLARAQDRRAWRALLARVERDDTPAVRRAAARALAVLSPPAARELLRYRAVGEADDEVRAWLERAAAGPGLPLGEGRQVLRLRVVTELPGAALIAQVLLPDGRWLRLPILPTGELFLADLPESKVDVQVQTRAGQV